MFQITNVNSLVFTAWRTTLDSLTVLLQQRNITYLRIDGLIKATERSQILSRFQTDPEVAVLLMTINSGAVGYVTSTFPIVTCTY